MTNFDIKISTSRYLNYSASLKRSLDRETSLLVMRDFAAYVKGVYLRLLISEINSNRYQGEWEPVDDKGYLEYLGTTPVDDIVSLIEDALEIRKVGYNLILQIDPSYKYPKSKHPLIKILRAIDKGTSDFNARPLISGVTRWIQSHLLELWRGYLTMKGIKAYG